MRIAKVVAFQRNQGRRLPVIRIFRFEYPNPAVGGNVAPALAECAVERITPSHEVRECVMRGLIPNPADLNDLHRHGGRSESTRGQN